MIRACSAIQLFVRYAKHPLELFGVVDPKNITFARATLVLNTHCVHAAIGASPLQPLFATASFVYNFDLVLLANLFDVPPGWCASTAHAGTNPTSTESTRRQPSFTGRRAVVLAREGFDGPWRGLDNRATMRVINSSGSFRRFCFRSES